MAQIRARAFLSSPFGTLQPGDIVDYPDEVAGSIVQAGLAEFVDGPHPEAPASRPAAEHAGQEPESSTLAPPENAVEAQPAPKRRGRPRKSAEPSPSV